MCSFLYFTHNARPAPPHRSNKNEHYFLAGTILTNLLLRAAHVARRHSARNPRSRSSAPSAHAQAMERLAVEARSLQTSLLTTMMGPRLCRNFDWTLSALDAMEDDVSEWIGRLTVLECKMFVKGVEASGAVKSWREYGSGRLGVSFAALKGRGLGHGPAASPNGEVGREKKRVVTPTGGAEARAF